MDPLGAITHTLTRGAGALGSALTQPGDDVTSPGDWLHALVHPWGAIQHASGSPYAMALPGVRIRETPGGYGGTIFSAHLPNGGEVGNLAVDRGGTVGNASVHPGYQGDARLIANALMNAARQRGFNLQRGSAAYPGQSGGLRFPTPSMPTGVLGALKGLMTGSGEHFPSPTGLPGSGTRIRK